MKRNILLSVFMLVSLFASAIPVKPGLTKSVVLNDGTELIVKFCGDEHMHWWETEDGRKVSVDDNNKARVIAQEEFRAMVNNTETKRAAVNNIRSKRMSKAKSAESSNFIGSKKGIVILVEFSDRTMSEDATREEFNDMFNKDGYNSNGHIGSVHDYYFDQSYGQFDLQFDVVGPVTLSNTLAYYGKNDSFGNDMHPAEMVIEACRLVDEEVDFADYDWDGDGIVEQVFVVYAGYGENAGAPKNTIWPHEYDLTTAGYYGDGEGSISLDDVIIDTYAVSCELSGTRGSDMNGIGVACHEFSHCLGYPDFYDVNYSGSWGMGYWDVLDSGSYNGPQMNGEVPAGFTSYERWVAGWIEPIELTPGMVVEALNPLADNPEAYVVYNDQNHNEYYLLENRTTDRWFSYWQSKKATNSGLLVLHVDYSESVWNNNSVNTNRSRQRMTIIPANDNLASGFSTTNYAGHLYPTAKNNMLTNESKPAAKVYNKNIDGTKFMNKPITNITKNEDGTISFSCEEMKDDDPIIDDPDDPIFDDGKIVFYESFDECAGKGGNDDLWSGNIASSTFKPDNDDWEYSKAFAGNMCARFGTGSFAGVAETPEFTLSGDAVLSFKAGAWGTDDQSLDIQVNGNIVKQVTMGASLWSEITIPLEETGLCKVKFVAGKRFFLDEVKVVEVADDIETGMFMPSAMVKTNEVYNIYGQRVDSVNASMKKGIYIVNGRKVLVK